VGGQKAGPDRKTQGISRLTTLAHRRERALLCAAVAKGLREMLMECGVSQSELARRLGTSRAHVTQILSGRRNLTLHTLAHVAAAAHCQVRLSVRPANYGDGTNGE